MCGIAGIMNLVDRPPIEQPTLQRMIATLKHRGPDGYGYHVGRDIGLAHARLSIIDLEGGWQPIYNEDRTLAIVFNGEIFNYIELRKELEARGHIFTSHSDTEVIVHLYEEKSERCLDDLNGQFAIALYDARNQSLFLARDRLGIRPLFYTTHQGRFYFGSEIKAIFSADPSIPRKMNSQVLAEIFTLWMPAGNETIFTNIRQLGAGHWARIDARRGFQETEYWDVPFGQPDPASERPEEDYVQELKELLIDSVRLQLRADVPVGAYLSGGLDSSTITALIRHYTDNPLKTFSVTFADDIYDESREQQLVVKHLTTDHHTVNCTYGKIAASFPEVVWHTETPILRTAPTPLYLLAGLVRENDYKVVLTGEGADEILGGYDLFKEAKIRAFIGKNPKSAFRYHLLRRLYPYLALSPTRSGEYSKAFFGCDAPDAMDYFFAHRPRWKTTARTRMFFSPELEERMHGGVERRLMATLKPTLDAVDYFTRAQYLETKLLLGNYLLSSQGDRMAMGHSVEGRYPFLDHRVVEFACTVPVRYRMKALNEKNILKKAMQGLLPAGIVRRKKQPYMAPDIASFFSEGSVDYLDHYLSKNLVKDAGFFQLKAVEQLVVKCRRGQRQGFMENMAFVGILSTQIIYDRFVKSTISGTPQGGAYLGELKECRIISQPPSNSISG